MNLHPTHQPSSAEIHALASHRDDHCLSLTMAVDADIDRDKERILSKNLLRTCERRLQERDATPRARRALLESLREALAEPDLGPPGNQGLALFHCAHATRVFPLPFRPHEECVMDDRFHLGPLLTIAGDARSYYVLALQLNDVRLFRATRRAITEVDLGDDVPRAMADAVTVDGDDHHQLHSLAKARGPAEPVYHGQGGGRDGRREKILRFFRILDDALARHLGNASAPMVLVGPGHLLPIFRDASRALDLLPEGIATNPESMSKRELRRACWPLVSVHMPTARSAALARVKQLEGSDWLTRELGEIVLAAYDGRLETLLLPRGSAQWGLFDAASRAVELRSERGADTRELYDLAATFALRTGAEVFVVGPDGWPEGTDATGILRHPSEAGAQ